MSASELHDGIVKSEHLGLRVFCLAAPDPQQLADHIALALGEHLTADDHMHITYNALQTGWQHFGVPGFLAGGMLMAWQTRRVRDLRLSAGRGRAGRGQGAARRANRS